MAIVGSVNNHVFMIMNVETNVVRWISLYIAKLYSEDFEECISRKPGFVCYGFMESDEMNEIMKIINKWDPIDFFPMASEDEYMNEITKIYNLKISDRDIQEEKLSQAINMIFLDTFGGDVYKENIEDCRKVGKEIKNVMID